MQIYQGTCQPGTCVTALMCPPYPPELIKVYQGIELLQPCARAQDGNLIICLDKSQFKPPRGLAFCLYKSLENAGLL